MIFRAEIAFNLQISANLLLTPTAQCIINASKMC